MTHFPPIRRRCEFCLLYLDNPPTSVYDEVWSYHFHCLLTFAGMEIRWTVRRIFQLIRRILR